MKRVDMTNVKEAGTFEMPAAGPYICKIVNVEDFPNREYLKVTFDIASGLFEGFYEKARNDHPDWEWAGAYSKSYKQSALGFFKRFCSAVSKSNGNFVFDGGAVNSDEQTLIGKRIGLVFREEEYYSNSGDKRTKLSVYSEFPVDKLKEQKVPKPVLLPDEPQGVDAFMSIPDDMNEEMPFA